MAISSYFDMWADPDPDNHEYRAPGPKDLRSPCPFLNTMANHGYVHRSGKHITWWAATCAMVECYNFSYPLAGIVAVAGVVTSLYMAYNPFWFDLEQQRVHTFLIEHDASLTRQDYPANNFTGDPKLVEELISQASASSPDGTPLLTLNDFAHHRVAREATLSYKLNKVRNILATGELGLVVPTFGRGSDIPEERKVSAAWIKTVFLDERLPDDWTRPALQLPFSSVNNVAAKARAEMLRWTSLGKY